MPDLNSVPASPHALAATVSRRASSHQMPPPPVPPSPSLNILPSNQNAVNQASSSSLPSPPLPTSGTLSGPPPLMGDNSGVGPGPGPIRHPRPMTAADLHLELEKEQEAVVNRLTRELSLLRAAQNASVVSNASSTSASASESAAGGRRHHRSASNTSTRSFTANAGSVSTTSVVGISAPAPVRPTNPNALGGVSLSRQNSTASRRSRASSPAPHTLQPSSQPHSYTHSHLNDPAMAGYFSHRVPLPPPTAVTTTSQPGAAAGAAAAAAAAATTPGGSISTSELSPGLLPATTRYEETAFYRSELDAVKRENDALKRRVRELERMVRERRASDASRASRGRSESVSTTASVSVSVAGGVAAGASIAGQREGGGGGGTPAAGGGGATAATAAAAGGGGGTAGGAAGGGGGARERPRVVSMLSTAGSVGVGVPDEELRVGESAASAGLRDRAPEPSA